LLFRALAPFAYEFGLDFLVINHLERQAFLFLTLVFKEVTIKRFLDQFAKYSRISLAFV